MPFAKENFFGTKSSIKKAIISKRLKHLDGLITHLKKRDAKIYTVKGCIWCKRQKDLINLYLPQLKELLVDVDKSTSLPKGVTGFPTLVLDTNSKKPIIQPGYKSLDRFKNLLNDLKNNNI